MSKIKVIRDGEEMQLGVDVTELGAIPDAMLGIAKHYGGGEYIAVDAESGERMFKLTYEWLDD